MKIDANHWKHQQLLVSAGLKIEFQMLKIRFPGKTQQLNGNQNVRPDEVIHLDIPYLI